MQKYTVSELQGMASESDWQRAAAMSDLEIEAAIASDDDEASMEVDFGKVDIAASKTMMNLRVDSDILTFFKATGGSYQARMNAVLRAYMQEHSQKP